MNLDLSAFEPIALMLTLGAAISLLLTSNWRLFLLALAIQYLGVFVLVTSHWPVGLAAVKVVVGWMTVAILGSSESGEDFQLPFSASRMGLIFRFITITIALWNIPEKVVVNMMPFVLIQHNDLHKLATFGSPVNGLILE